MENAIVRFEGVSKFFPGIVANNKIDLSIRAGETHSLLGENGAGKSTLMNMLYGLYRPDEGSIFVNGNRAAIASPNDAIHLGIGMIHQHFMLIPSFTVWENVTLGQKSEASPLLPVAQLKKRVASLADELNIKIDVDDRVEDLCVGMQQKVEILKAIYRGSKVLILDEPTSVLTPGESEDLFVMLRRLKEQGSTIIFISHKLKEVMAISDRVSVLRDGELIKTLDIADCTGEGLTKLMVGREVSLQIDKEAASVKDVALELKEVSLEGASSAHSLHNINLSVRGGEILGIAGVDGNGQNELAGIIAGTLKPTSGRILFQNRDVTRWNVRERAMKTSFSYVPADRRNEGLVLDFKLYENATLTHYYNSPFSSKKILRPKAMRKNASEQIRYFNIKAPNCNIFARTLSGGNQQKIVLAREIQRSPDILLVVQPTWGLDIGACSFVYEKLLEERRRGAAILLISTDLEEVRRLSDRLMVIYEGSIVGEVDPSVTEVEQIGLMMAGSQI
ncbi:MAG: ABC transporter ATP-binding protein [Bacillota bacterium]